MDSHAVVASNRLSNDIDEREVQDENTAEIIREWRDKRYADQAEL